MRPSSGSACCMLLMLLGLYVRLARARRNASLGLGTFFALIPAFFLSHAYASLPDATIVAVLFLAAILNVFGYFGLFVMVDALGGPHVGCRPRGESGRTSRRVRRIDCRRRHALFRALTVALFTGCPPLVNVRIVIACYAVVIVLCFALLWRGMRAPERSTGRGRLRWVFWATVVGFSGPLVSFRVHLDAGRPIRRSMASLNLSFLAVPLGYTYAVLRHRVIDVGFVLNRALSLTIHDDCAHRVLHRRRVVARARLAVGHVESTLVQIGFSLGLGMLFNKVHAWLEDRLERVLFRRRYALEESLRNLG